MKAVAGLVFIGLLSSSCATPSKTGAQNTVPATLAVTNTLEIEAKQEDEPGMTMGEFLTSCTTNADCPAAGELNAYKYKCVREGGRLGKCQRDKIEIAPKFAPGEEGKFCVRKESKGEYCEICTFCIGESGKSCGVSGSFDCWWPGYVDPQYIPKSQSCPTGYVDVDSLTVDRTTAYRQAYCGYRERGFTP